MNRCQESAARQNGLACRAHIGVARPLRPQSGHLPQILWTLCGGRAGWGSHAAGAGDGQACPWTIAKDAKIESTDRAIDKLVSPFGDDVRVVPLRYASGMIYGLSEEEIKIVES
jgi:hypothetical protein